MWSQQGSQSSGWKKQPQYNPHYGGAGHVTPHLLVESLANFPTFSASLLQLMEDVNLHPLSVREVTSSYPQIFHLNGEIVELKPQISMCIAHSGPQGCVRRSTCNNLHICPDYVLGWCHDKSCALGHKWHTDHNISVLKPFSLEHLQLPKLRKLVQSLSKMSSPGHLEVCHNYNEGGCSQTDCDALHVCRSYVTGLTRCSIGGCQLNHDLFSPDCCHLLRTHGLSTNEAPRDIVLALLAANPTLDQAEQSYGQRNKYSPQKLAHHQTPEKGAKKNWKIKRLNDNHKENETKIIGTTKKGNLKKGKYAGRKSESQSSSTSVGESDDMSSLSSEEKNKIKMGGRKKGHSKKGKHVSSESEAASKTESESESDDSDNVSSSLSEMKNVKKTSNTKKRGKSIKGKYSNSDDIYLSDRTDNESGSDQSDIENAPSSDIEKSQSETYIKKKKISKSKILKEDKVPRSSDQSTPPASTNSTPVKQVNCQTLWSHHLQGDAPVLEICYYSVESMCKYEGSGCQRLHSTQHFHWQVTEQGNRWFNLRPNQVTCLERSFCDPSQDGVDLPRLDPATLERSVIGLFILMGRDTWQANFKAMNLSNSSKSKTLQIRRLCTETISGQIIQPTNFIWYFLDKNQKWVKYGNVDTVGETTLVSSATSDDIEKHFKQNPSVPMSFQNSSFTYILDFNTMMQTNQKTNVSREVRRRPEPHLPDEKAEKNDQKTSTDLPRDWDMMQPEERMRLVALAPSSSEYQTVVGLLTQSIANLNVIKVERIQNPYLWRALQNKIKEMSTIYGDASKVDVRQLFHGTRADVVSSICAENFDWRLHGSSTGQAFGQGTYFATRANYSYGYCRVDSSNMKYMFVARTAVGTMTIGNSSMVRPPLNSATNALFDSTVDRLPTPSIIVKYDKQEYYPEYLLTLT